MNFYKKKANLITLFISAVILSIAILTALGTHAGAKNKITPAKQVFTDYYYTLSFIDLYKGDLNTAIFNYKKVLPYLKNPKIYNEYLDMLLYAKKLNQAEYFLNKAIKLFPDYKTFYRSMLDIMIVKRQDEKAVHYIEKNKRIFGEGFDTYEKLAILYMKNARYGKAVTYFKKALHYKKNYQALYFLAQCYNFLNQTDNAIKYAAESVKMNGHSLEIKMFLGSLYEKVKKYDKAIELYKTMNLRMDMKYAAIGNDYYLAGNIKKAFTYFNKAYKEHNSLIYAEKALYMLMRLGKYNDVIDFIEKNKIPLKSDKIKYFYAVSLMSKNMYAKAAPVFNMIQPSSPLFKDALYNEIICYSKMNEKEKAFDVLSSVKHKDSDIYYMIANLYLKYKEYKKAINTIQRSINIFQDKSKAYFYMADVYYDKLKNRTQGIKYLKKSLKINPNNSMVLNYLGYLYIDENINIKMGMKLVEKALQIQPDNPYYLDSLGWGYYKIGKYEKAVQLLKKALSERKNLNMSDDVVIKLHLVRVYIKSNEVPEAKKLLHGILKKFPKNKEAKKLLNELK